MKSYSMAEVQQALIAARNANTIGCKTLASALIKAYPAVILLIASTALSAKPHIG